MLNGAIPWFSNDFFMSKVPNLARLVDKNPEQSNMAIKKACYESRSQNLSKYYYNNILRIFKINKNSILFQKFSTNFGCCKHMASQNAIA